MWNKLFEGWYFKHQINGETVAFIPGYAKSGAFIQVITNEGPRQYEVPEIVRNKKIHAGACTFGEGGIEIQLPDIYGKIWYGPFSQLESDIMGPFRFLPMECRHGVISMGHELAGSLTIDGRKMIFDGGRGYIEKDSGRSFPREYVWLQCNDFAADLSIMVSVAEIPFAGFHFKGCICSILYEGREYRLATYHGVKIIEAGPKHIRLLQHHCMLDIQILGLEDGHPLKSPVRGTMTGIIRESNRAAARFRFWQKEKLLFDLTSANAGFEYFK